MDFWTSANAPWWLSVLTLLIGLFGAYFTTKHADERKFRVEEQRLDATRTADRAKYLENRLLDEIGLLIGGAEKFRVHLASSMNEIARGADGKILHDGGENDTLIRDLMNGSGSVIEPFRTQIARVEMIASGDLRQAVIDLEARGRTLALALGGTDEDFEEAHSGMRGAISQVIESGRARVGLADVD